MCPPKPAKKLKGGKQDECKKEREVSRCSKCNELLKGHGTHFRGRSIARMCLGKSRLRSVSLKNKWNLSVEMLTGLYNTVDRT